MSKATLLAVVPKASALKFLRINLTKEVNYYKENHN